MAEIFQVCRTFLQQTHKKNTCKQNQIKNEKKYFKKQKHTHTAISDLNQSETIVTIDGIDCTTVTWDPSYSDSSNLNNITCYYGAGVSGFGTQGLGSIALLFRAFDNGTNAWDEVEATSVKYFNYSYPDVANVTVTS